MIKVFFDTPSNKIKLCTQILEEEKIFCAAEVFVYIYFFLHLMLELLTRSPSSTNVRYFLLSEIDIKIIYLNS